MNLEEAIRGRCSVREYTSDAVDESTIRELIDAAILAPNAVNQQPWMFTVVRDQTVLKRISDGAKAQLLATMPGAGADHFGPQLRDASFHIFYHAPVLILISAVAAGPWIVEDCALAAENLMLCAHAAGLGTCWIGFAQGFLNTRDGKALLGLPASSVSVAPIIVGHPRHSLARVPRKKPDIHWVG